MKKVFMVLFALFISVAFVSTVFAQAKPEAKPAAEKPAAVEKATPEKAAPEKAAAPEKPKPKPKPKGVFIGNVAAVDAGMKTVSVTSKEGTLGEKGSVTFDLSKATFKGYKAVGDIKTGDKVAVKYTKDGVNIDKIGGAKPEKAKKAAKGFKDVDKNQDGKITIQELVIIFINVTPEQFKAFDKNSDGFLDEKEYGDAVKQMK